MIIKDVPLFPLNTVLFPQMFQALQIFEPRYRLMINECLRDDKPFGIVLIDGNFSDAKEDMQGIKLQDSSPPLHSVGTLAKITDVTRLDDGRMLISTIGTERFRLLQHYEEKAYVTADIELWPDGQLSASSAETDQLVGRVTQVFQNYLDVLMNIAHKRIEDLDIPEDPAVLSYVIPHWLPQISLEDKQNLLENEDPYKRLHNELTLLISETEFLHKIMQHSEETEQEVENGIVRRSAFNIGKRFSQN
jgi:Lon protease-like protein